MTPRDLQTLRNMGNEAEEAADEIDRLRAELERLRAQEPVAWIWHQHLGEKTKSLRWTKPSQWEYAEKLEPLYAAPPAQPAPAHPEEFTLEQYEAEPVQRLTLAQATAPREIWLQISDEADDNAEAFPDDHDGITWCQNSVLTCEVKFVRADLSAIVPPGHVVVPVEPTQAMLASVDAEADDKYVARGRAFSAWKSMIAAAPKD